MNIVTKTINLADGRSISIETGKLAKQANGSVVVRLGDTMLLATVVANQDAKEGVDFLPLTVEYREKFASAGKFPGGFFKREARPTDDEILTMRLVDRALRPLFPSDFHADTQVQIMLISADQENMPDALACLAASSALAVSNIPFNGPVSEVRVGRLNGQFVINPTISQLKESDFDMVVAGTADHIVMVEGEMDQVSEAEMLDAIKFAHIAIIEQCKVMLDLGMDVAKSMPKREYNHEASDQELAKRIKEATYEKCYQVAKSGHGKEERSEAFSNIKAEFVETLSEEEAAEKSFLIGKYFHDVEKEAMRAMVINDKIRLDGRKTNEIRPIWSEVNYLPGTHGSALFTRGETQSLTTLTLGSKMDEQTIDGAINPRSDKFLLHYTFPPFSTGEARPIRGVSRREVGHGNLAMRALKAVVPKAPENPYTIRLTSEILESNGSSSMASVCAGCLALMDGGIQITAPVSGIAMGLISGSDGKYAILSDILGDEDHLGDMDFKVAGTEKGITACQMDIKIGGLSHQIMEEALAQAKEGRLHILGEMKKTMDKPNSDYKTNAPRIEQMVISKDLIGAVIGPGGKIIQKIQEDTGATIILEEVEGKGVIDIISNNKESSDAAIQRIKEITYTPDVGDIIKGKVKSVVQFGAFVEIAPGKDGLVHISELEWYKVDNVEDVLKEGDMVEVKIIGVDPKTQKVKLSRKVLLPKPERQEN
ncbi:MAG: polyribonucleotide nucleotidyltransferase [Vicingaceae bacterium]